MDYTRISEAKASLVKEIFKDQDVLDAIFAVGGALEQIDSNYIGIGLSRENKQKLAKAIFIDNATVKFETCGPIEFGPLKASYKNRGFSVLYTIENMDSVAVAFISKAVKESTESLDEMNAHPVPLGQRTKDRFKTVEPNRIGSRNEAYLKNKAIDSFQNVKDYFRNTVKNSIGDHTSDKPTRYEGEAFKCLNQEDFEDWDDTFSLIELVYDLSDAKPIFNYLSRLPEDDKYFASQSSIGNIFLDNEGFYAFTINEQDENSISFNLHCGASIEKAEEMDEDLSDYYRNIIASENVAKRQIDKFFGIISSRIN